MTDTTTIQVNPTRVSDQVAYIDAARQGTGAVLTIRLRGQRGGERQENLGLTAAMRHALIAALGGVPANVADADAAVAAARGPLGPTVLWSWNVGHGSWVETGPGGPDAVVRKYDSARKYDITGAAFVVMPAGVPPAGRPVDLGIPVT